MPIRLFRPALGAAVAVLLTASTARPLRPLRDRGRAPRPRSTCSSAFAVQTARRCILLGSVHLLSPESATLPAEVDAAFAQAKSVGFETSIDSLQLRAQELLMRARYANGATLRRSLSPATVAQADSLVSGYGMSSISSTASSRGSCPCCLRSSCFRR